MKTKNQLVISMVPIYSRSPWASCNLYTSYCVQDAHWRNYVRRVEAAVSGHQAAGGASEFNQNYVVGQ